MVSIGDINMTNEILILMVLAIVICIALMIANISIKEERNHGDIKEHKHAGYDYWHPATRMHAESTKDEPSGHVLSKKPLAEKLVLDLVGITPIQKMKIGASLEIGAVQSLMEGLQCHRYAASCLVSDSCTLSECTTGVLFYAEWEPNHSQKTHRYLIAVRGEDVYVGYFPYDGRKPRLYGIHHKKQDVVKFLHKTYKPDLQLPELTLLTELNIPNISFGWAGDQRGSEISRDRDRVNIHHKQGTFYTRSIYGEFTPLSECNFIPDPPSKEPGITEVSGKWEKPIDATGFNIGDPKHPWYMFQGATGYVQLFEGKMFCYPDGSIRFLTKEQEETIFRGYTDLQIVQGDLVAYEVGLPDPLKWNLSPSGGVDTKADIDRHEVRSDKRSILRFEEKHFITEDSILTITHPEHGECKYEARKGEMLALLPGTSRPFQKDEGRD